MSTKHKVAVCVCMCMHDVFVNGHYLFNPSQQLGEPGTITSSLLSDKDKALRGESLLEATQLSKGAVRSLSSPF